MCQALCWVLWEKLRQVQVVSDFKGFIVRARKTKNNSDQLEYQGAWDSQGRSSQMLEEFGETHVGTAPRLWGQS